MLARGFLALTLITTTVVAQPPERSQAETDAAITKFYELAASGKTQEALGMLDDPNFHSLVDSDGHNALFAAVAAGNEPLTKRLLAMPQNLGRVDKTGASAVWLAATSAPGEILQLLLDRGASPTQADASGMPPIIAAAIAGNHSAVTVLVRAGAPIETRWEGFTALQYAVAKNHPEVVRELLRFGADRGGRFGDKSLVEFASSKGFHEVANLLASTESAPRTP